MNQTKSTRDGSWAPNGVISTANTTSSLISAVVLENLMATVRKPCSAARYGAKVATGVWHKHNCPHTFGYVTFCGNASSLGGTPGPWDTCCLNFCDK
eukprot:16446814-Heterocapsa_arctica.AAC.1